MNRLIQKIVDVLEDARLKYEIEKEELERNGVIIYANGNDGTDFDWDVNNRSCEFGYGVKDGSVWAFKLLVDSSGDGTIYCYPHGEMKPVETIRTVLMDKYEAEELKNIMLETADGNMMWNCTLEELGLV